MALEERIRRLEDAYEQVDKRLDDLSRAIEGLRTEGDTFSPCSLLQAGC